MSKLAFLNEALDIQAPAEKKNWTTNRYLIYTWNTKPDEVFGRPGKEWKKTIIDLQDKQELGGGFNFFNFHPYLGKIPILTSIFQGGWNHQPEKNRHLWGHIL